MKILAYFKQFPDIPLFFGLALLVRLLAAWPQQQPNYMDAAYSYVNALNLVAGRGFVEDFVWNYLGNPGLPPQPSHLYWMPLTSIIAWLGMAIGGASYRAAQIPFVFLSALLAPVSYGIAYSLSGRRDLSRLAGLLAIFSGFYFPFWTAIDNFTPFAVAGSLALVCAWKGSTGIEGGEERSRRAAESLIFNLPSAFWLALSGVFVGLAHLSRADGVLLLIVIILVYAIRHLYYARQSKHSILPVTFHVLRITFYLLLGYLLIMTPWFIRNWQVAGAPLPAGGTKTIWLNNYDDLFSYQKELSARSFFSQGWSVILQGRWWVFITNLQTVIAVWGMIFLGPLAIAGGWQRRDQLLVQLAGVYAFLLIGAMTVVFAFPGALGGLFHSGAAVFPFIVALAMVGLDWGVDWVAVRRRGWQAPAAKRVFGIGLVILAIGLSSFIYYGRVLRGGVWNQADASYPAIATWVKAQDPAAVVMIGNPPAYQYHGGGLSVVVPNENIETMLKVARRYEVDYLVLDYNRPAPLDPLYQKPSLHPGLVLVQTYGQGSGKEIYVFEIRE